jgi:Tfp pilus assembly protein PilW
MMNWLQASKKGCSGQAMVEYLIVFIALFLIVGVMALSLYTVRQQANRTLDLVGSDYP